MHATEDIPYPAYIHRVTQIDHLATMLHLAGADAPDLGTARVLDLGCAYGTNLVPMALAYPDAEFLGLDIDEKAISEGTRFNRSLGLENVTLLATGDMRAAVAGRQFDYIIAHGLFSWMDDGVREEILRLIAETRAPGGVAYLSYNCYPGWLGAYAMRDLLSLSTAGLCGSARTGVLRGQFTAMSRALEADPAKRSHAPQMLADIRSFQKMEDGHLAGELCAESCDPFYLTEFAEMAGARSTDDARALINGLQGEDRSAAVIGLASPWAAKDPQAALNFLATENNPEASGTALYVWSSSDPTAAYQ